MQDFPTSSEALRQLIREELEAHDARKAEAAAFAARPCTHPICSLKWGQCERAGGRTAHFDDCPAVAA